MSEQETPTADPAQAQPLHQEGLHLLQQDGDRWQGIEKLMAAHEADMDDMMIAFDLAYQLDLVGEEERALHLYERIAQQSNPPLNVLVNLAVLYEDRGHYVQAERCIRQVLATDPNHERAILYVKDVEASKQMLIEEDKDRRQGSEAQLDRPVTDFDLSVRTRNALRKMNIRTLGELLAVTEPELRSYKNFGEASIEEVKAMLAQQNLRLGQTRENRSEADKEAVYQQLQDETGADQQQLQQSVNDLDLSVRARKALALLNVQTIGDLCMKTEAELMGVKNFGMTSLQEIKDKLAENGLSLRKLD